MAKKMSKNKDTLVPYDRVSPGFEAVYTGETSSTPVRENQMVSTPKDDEEPDTEKAKLSASLQQHSLHHHESVMYRVKMQSDDSIRHANAKAKFHTSLTASL